MEKEPITSEGLEKIKKELEELKNIKRPKIIEAIAEARAHGDLKENAEYHAAKEEQAKIESRVIEIKSNISFKKSDIGESVCCDGVCLTLIRIKKKSFLFYLSKETLNRSNFKTAKVGKYINIEKSLHYGKKYLDTIFRATLIQHQLSKV